VSFVANSSSFCLQALPADLGALTRLQLLSADDNQIASVPSAIMMHCSSLTTLTLHANPVTLEVSRKKQQNAFLCAA